jgi:hypothetical protein
MSVHSPSPLEPPNEMPEGFAASSSLSSEYMPVNQSFKPQQYGILLAVVTYTRRVADARFLRSAEADTLRCRNAQKRVMRGRANFCDTYAEEPIR